MGQAIKAQVQGDRRFRQLQQQSQQHLSFSQETSNSANKNPKSLEDRSKRKLPSIDCLEKREQFSRAKFWVNF